MESNIRVIAQSNVGIINQSKSCGCLNLSLRQVSIHFSAKGLLQFGDHLAHLSATTRCPTDEHVFVPTPHEGLCLYFTIAEFNELQKMVSHALLILGMRPRLTNVFTNCN